MVDVKVKAAPKKTTKKAVKKTAKKKVEKAPVAPMKVPKKATAETEIGSALMRRLTEWQWECYPEVQLKHFSSRADLAAVRQGRLMVVEMKTHLTFEVIAQALRWIGTAHYVAIGVPAAKNGSSHRNLFIRTFLKEKGIGLFVIKPGEVQESGLSSWDTARVEEDIAPRLNRHAHAAAKDFMAELNPDMRVVEPGSRKGYTTDFKRTLRRIEGYVKDHPGVSLKMVIDNVEHHYANALSACGAIAKLIHLVEGVQVVRRGRKIFMFPVGYEIPPWDAPPAWDAPRAPVAIWGNSEPVPEMLKQMMATE